MVAAAVSAETARVIRRRPSWQWLHAGEVAVRRERERDGERSHVRKRPTKQVAFSCFPLLAYLLAIPAMETMQTSSRSS